MLSPDAVSTHFNLGGPVRPVADPGLINHTWSVGTPPHAILQWVNPIFDPNIHLDIDAVTGRLADHDLPTPRLIPAVDGGLWKDDPGGGCWRALTYMPGRTLHRLSGPQMAHTSGHLVGRFHAALDGWAYSFRARRRNIHETPARFDELHSALREVTSHALLDPAHGVADELLRRWTSWEGTMDLPRRPCHGDLKVSNLRYDDRGRAHCLVDLDTLGPQRIVDEMGDAWRSWCNPHGENDPATCRFDTELFAASVKPWLAAVPHLQDDERRNLVGAIERICLELAARFLTDALRNSYFREDRQRFPEAGAHNLVRARCQLALAVSARQQRTACEAIVHGAQ